MKRLLIILTACLMFKVGKAQELTYVISGVFENANENYIYLSDEPTKSNATKHIVDSAAIVNGKFSMNGKIVHMAPYALFFKQTNKYLSLLLDGSRIHITGNALNINLSKVSGSVENDKMKLFETQLATIRATEEKIFLSLIEFSNKKDTANIAIHKKRLDSVQIKLYQQTNILISANHPSYAALTYLTRYRTKLMQPEQIEAMLKSYPANYQQLPLYHEIKAELWSVANLKPGNFSINFTLPDQKNSTKSLSDFKGKYVLLDFWASWCVPCRAENPNLKLAMRSFKNKGFEILSVSIDKDSFAWKKAVQDDGLDWTQLIAIKGDADPAISKYAIKQIPTNYLLGPDGKIIAKNLRGSKLNQKLQEIFSGR